MNPRSKSLSTLGTLSILSLLISSISFNLYSFAIRYCGDKLTTDRETMVRFGYSTGKPGILAKILGTSKAVLLTKNGWFGELDTGDKPTRISIEYLDHLKGYLAHQYKKYEFTRYVAQTPGEVHDIMNNTWGEDLGKLELLVGPQDSILLKDECSLENTNEKDVFKRSCRLVAYRLPQNSDVGKGYLCSLPLSGDLVASTPEITDTVKVSYKTLVLPEESSIKELPIKSHEHTEL